MKESLTSEQLLENEEIKNKVRDIQNRYCGESVETKLYYAIKETIDTKTKDGEIEE